MSTEVVMPQMGESIAEGTITKWLKQVGERVERDEPLFEISTDKVDAEIPAPAAGVLQEIRHKEGETVEVGAVVALLGDGAGASANTVTAAPQAQTAAPPAPQASQPEAAQPAPPAPVPPPPAPTPQATPPAPAAAPPTAAAAAPAATGGAETEVVMPQMGESIAEGTITKWLKQIGERVERDEPLFEISTDKVDAEIPSPAAGVLQEIRNKEGETVEVGAVVAVIGSEAGAGAAASPTSAAPVAEESASQTAMAAETSYAAQPASPQTSSAPAQTPAPPARPAAVTNGDKRDRSIEELRRTRSSPLVRKIAQEHGIDISQLEGTGISGRVTKNDILSYIESGAAAAPTAAAPAQEARAPQTPAAPPQAPTPPAPPVKPATGDRVEPMSVIRRKIAEHMIMSRRTSAHVTTVYEMDMTRIAKLREQHKRAFQERYGTKLTYMPFIFQAITQGIRRFPIFNSQVSGDQIIYKRDINLGLAVALDWGLIVPVIKRADELSLAGLARAANDLADRARAKQLKPDEVSGGTFTITNPGVFGGLFGTPIINQPQVAILGVGAIEKRPKVMTSPEGDDYLAIRHLAYFALSFDHRIIDGADAERFLAYVKELLEAGQYQL